MRGMNPKQLQRMLRQQGIEMEELEATEVIIKLADKALVLKSPQVSKMTASGSTTFQVVGKAKEVSLSQLGGAVAGSLPPGKAPAAVTTMVAQVRFTDEDLALVMEQTGASEAKARKALEACGGAPAEAIIRLLG